VKAAKRKFDPQAFLAKVGTGKAISKYRNAFGHGNYGFAMQLRPS
jgi:hypothetical protein